MFARGTARTNGRIVQMLMRKKSVKSLRAARLLTKRRLYSQATHHLYYSVFQLMKYLLANTPNAPISYEMQNEISRRRGSHYAILCEIQDRINNEEDTVRFTEGFRYLKQQRIWADYTTSFINAPQCKENFKIAESLRSQLYYQFRQWKRNN